MKKEKLLLALLCTWGGMLPLAAQSVKITKELTHVQMASVLAMYKNEFGTFEKPALDDTFPFAVIRMHLEGNAHAVSASKERLTLYLGQQFGVESRVTTHSNQILFLVRARRPYIYIDCGDGCEPKLLSGGQQLRSNCLYDCTVRYTPAGETPSNVDTELLSNLETRLDSLQLVQEQKIESLQQAQKQLEEKPLIVKHTKYDQKLFGIEEYSYGQTQMDKKALQVFLQENSPQAHKKYMESQKLIKSAWAIFGVGSGVMLSSFIGLGHQLGAAGDSTWGWPYYISALSVGSTLMTIAIPILGVGYHRRNHAYEVYNMQQKKSQPQLSLGVQANENGIGLALSF